MLTESDIDSSSYRDDFEDLDFEDNSRKNLDDFFKNEAETNEMHQEQMNIKDEEIRIL